MAKNTNQSIKQLQRLVTDSPSKPRQQVIKQLKKDFQEWLKKFQSVAKQSTHIVSELNSFHSLGPSSNNSISLSFSLFLCPSFQYIYISIGSPWSNVWSNVWSFGSCSPWSNVWIPTWTNVWVPTSQCMFFLSSFFPFCLVFSSVLDHDLSSFISFSLGGGLLSP